MYSVWMARCMKSFKRNYNKLVKLGKLCNEFSVCRIDLPMVKWAQRMISRVKAVDMPIPDVETTINSGKA